MSESSDPYRFGAPTGPVASAPTGREIVETSWRLLRQDRRLLWLPVLGSLAGLVAAAIVFVPGFLLGDSLLDQRRAGVTVGSVFAGFALSMVGIYFQSAMVIGAFERAEGRTPTLGGVLAQTWSRKREIVAWALVSSTVGAVMRAVEQRIGIAGRLLGFLGGLVWAVATFLAVPVVVAERLGPFAAVKRSGQLLRDTWGTSLRTTVRIGFGATVLAIPFGMLTFTGGVLLMVGEVAAGLLLLLVGIGGLLALAAACSAVVAYA